jgi:hypothetical protein
MTLRSIRLTATECNCQSGSFAKPLWNVTIATASLLIPKERFDVASLFGFEPGGIAVNPAGFFISG